MQNLKMGLTLNNQRDRLAARKQTNKHRMKNSGETMYQILYNDLITWRRRGSRNKLSGKRTEF